MKEYPKKFKYGRLFRVKLKNKHKASSLLNVCFYEYGLKALENGKLSFLHLSSIMRMVKRKFKKELFIKLNIFMITPVTKKPREARMGKGKGQRFSWEYNVKKGMLVLEVGGDVKSQDKLFRMLDLIKEKLPINTSVVRVVY